jgi:hypothetical protein
MSQRFRYPSPELPPYAAFEIAVPDGWQPGEAPDCIGVFYDPAAEGFRVNVLVSADRIAAGIGLEDAARATLEQMSTHRDFRIEQEWISQVDGQTASMRFQSYEADGAPDRIVQLQVLFFAPADGRTDTRDLFQLDGTCLAGHAEHYTAAFAEIAQSFRFSA